MKTPFELKPPPRPPEWCSVIPDRSPVQKIHKNRGQAIAAISHTRPFGRTGSVYRWDFAYSEWVLEADNNQERPCIKCGKIIKAKDVHDSFTKKRPILITYDEGGNKLKVLDTKVICWECAPVDTEAFLRPCSRCGNIGFMKWNGVHRTGLEGVLHDGDEDHEYMVDPKRASTYTDEEVLAFKKELERRGFI